MARFVASCGFEVDREVATALADAATTRRLSTGEFLFQTGDPSGTLHLIRSGLVEVVVVSRGGQELVYRTLGPKSLIGELTLLEEVPRTAAIRATKPTSLVEITRTAFLGVSREHPDAALALARISAQRARLLSLTVEQVSFEPLPGRLRVVLGQLAGIDADGGTAVVITQAELAKRLGVSRESVNRQLQDWKRAGRIELGRGLIRVLDPAVLA